MVYTGSARAPDHKLYDIRRILSWNLDTPQKLIRYIECDLPIRSFSEILEAFGYCEDRRSAIIASMQAYEPDLPPDSTRRKVENWLRGQHIPRKRMDMLRLCFALELGEAQAETFMSLCEEGGLHHRNPEDLSYLFCIRTGQDYLYARELISALLPIEKEGSPSQTVRTEDIRAGFAHVHTEKEFLAFIAHHLPYLGNHRNTAFRYFQHFYNLLAAPGGATWDEDTSYSIDRLVDSYLRMNLRYEKNTSKYTAIQKIVRLYWPNTTSIKNMRNQKEDISRKVLLLLYVVTNGDHPEKTYTYGDTSMGLEQQFTAQVHAVNHMLDLCCMRALDPRNPFDLLVLCSIADEESMAERLQILLAQLFSEKK